MINYGLGNFSDEQIAVYDELHILSFNPKVGEECNEVQNNYAPEIPATACRYIYQRPNYPYANRESEALETLAEYDAVAALIMARRSTNEDERINWYLRAAAISEKSGPIMALANLRYNAITVIKPIEKKMVTHPAVDMMTKRIALEIILHKWEIRAQISIIE
jgi:hypothetical protein